jgi:hypothetical protein
MLLLKPWHDLSRRERWTKALLLLTDISLFVVAWRDLRRRPAERIRGSRGLWFCLLFIDYLGPLAYLLGGRKHPAEDE